MLAKVDFSSFEDRWKRDSTALSPRDFKGQGSGEKCSRRTGERQQPVSGTSSLDIAGRAFAGDPAEDSATRQGGAACVIAVKDPSCDLPGGIQAFDRLQIGIKDLAFRVGAQAAKSKREPAGDFVSAKRRAIDSCGEVCLGRV